MENPVKMEFSKFYCTIISRILLSDLTGLMRLGLVVSPVFGAGVKIHSSSIERRITSGVVADR